MELGAHMGEIVCDVEIMPSNIWLVLVSETIPSPQRMAVGL